MGRVSNGWQIHGVVNSSCPPVTNNPRALGIIPDPQFPTCLHKTFSTIFILKKQKSYYIWRSSSGATLTIKASLQTLQSKRYFFLKKCSICSSMSEFLLNHTVINCSIIKPHILIMLSSQLECWVPKSRIMSYTTFMFPRAYHIPGNTIMA